MRRLAVPLDRADRRILGMGLVVVALVVLALVTLAGAAGIAVRVFTLLAWG
jgi:hypothetical protein